MYRTHTNGDTWKTKLDKRIQEWNASIGAACKPTAHVSND